MFVCSFHIYVVHKDNENKKKMCSTFPLPAAISCIYPENYNVDILLAIEQKKSNSQSLIFHIKNILVRFLNLFWKNRL